MFARLTIWVYRPFKKVSDTVRCRQELPPLEVKSGYQGVVLKKEVGGRSGGRQALDNMRRQ